MRPHASKRFPRENVWNVEERGPRLESCGIPTFKWSVEEKERDWSVARVVASRPKQSSVLETKGKESAADEGEINRDRSLPLQGTA